MFSLMRASGIGHTEIYRSCMPAYHPLLYTDSEYFDEDLFKYTFKI
jgi:hypothetical protein